MKYAWISTFRIFSGFGVSIHSDCFGAFDTWGCQLHLGHTEWRGPEVLLDLCIWISRERCRVETVGAE